MKKFPNEEDSKKEYKIRNNTKNKKIRRLGKNDDKSLQKIIN